MSANITELFQFPRNNFLEFVVAAILIRQAVFYKESFEFSIPSVNIVKTMPDGMEISIDDVVKATWLYVEETLIAGEVYLGAEMQTDAYLTDYAINTTKKAIVHGLTKRLESKQQFTLRVRYHARLTQTVEHWFHNQ